MTGAHVLAAVLAAAVLGGCGANAVDRHAVAPAGGDPMTALHRQAGQLLSGGASAFRARLASLQGHPVVVNQWASWCGPCRYEFPFFDRLARRYAGRVAFVGVDSLDSSSAARSFLSRHRVPYAHYADPDGKVARVFHGGRLFPTTAFYDADGELVATHAGAYRDARALDIDIRRYALDG